nr:MAG TPA: hypothetical protein [Caudoviricetes sp.]
MLVVVSREVLNRLPCFFYVMRKKGENVYVTGERLKMFV